MARLRCDVAVGEQRTLFHGRGIGGLGPLVRVLQPCDEGGDGAFRPVRPQQDGMSFRIPLPSAFREALILQGGLLHIALFLQVPSYINGVIRGLLTV